MSCKGIEGYAENFADKKLREQQDEIIKKHLYLLDNGTLSIKEVAEMCNTTVEHVEEIRALYHKENRRMTSLRIEELKKAPVAPMEQLNKDARWLEKEILRRRLSQH